MVEYNVLITGSSTGIGFAATEYLAERQFKVYAGARKQEDLDNLGKISNVIPVKLDVTNQSDIDKIKDTMDADGIRLDAIVNNAGITIQGPILELSVDDLKKQLDVNLYGVHRVTSTLFPLIHKSKGRIVNISSVAGKMAFPFLAPYCISKFSLEAYSDSLRRELLPFDVKVIVIQPGSIKTPIWDKANTADTRFAGSIFEKYARAFGRYFVKQGKQGLDVDEVSKVIHRALIAGKPKHRYLVTEGNLRYRLMRNLPSSFVDRSIKKGFEKYW